MIRRTIGALLISSGLVALAMSVPYMLTHQDPRLDNEVLLLTHHRVKVIDATKCKAYDGTEYLVLRDNETCTITFHADPLP